MFFRCFFVFGWWRSIKATSTQWWNIISHPVPVLVGRIVSLWLVVSRNILAHQKVTNLLLSFFPACQIEVKLIKDCNSPSPESRKWTKQQKTEARWKLTWVERETIKLDWTKFEVWLIFQLLASRRCKPMTNRWDTQFAYSGGLGSLSASKVIYVATMRAFMDVQKSWKMMRVLR